MQTNKKKLHIIFGPQGAGKSTYAKKLAEETGGVHFAIDDWMWRLYGPDMPQSFPWIMERVARCEVQIRAIARQVLQRGGTVVLDLGFMKERDRENIARFAADAGFATQLHYVNAPLATRQKRVMDRNANKGDTFSFEVSLTMFDAMEGQFEKPSEKELTEAIVVETA